MSFESAEAAACFSTARWGVEGMLSCEEPPHYIIFDHLSEGAMSHFLQQRQHSEDAGHSANFIDIHVGPYLDKLMAAGVKLITNAGGLNPQAAVRALQKRAAELGISPKIAVVDGDDLRHRLDELNRDGYREMFTNEAIPPRSLRPMPISVRFHRRGFEDGRGHRAHRTGGRQRAGAGTMIYEFGWKREDYDRWQRAPQRAISSNAARNPPAVYSPTGWTCPMWTTSAFPSPSAAPMVRSC